MELVRKRMFHAFKAAREAGPYDELPMLREDIDFQVHLSRNDRAQPFFLIDECDSMLVQLSGTGIVEMKYSPVRYHTLEPGDIVYLPAGTPHRLVPSSESVQLCYRSKEPRWHAVAWFCRSCDAEVSREEFHTSQALPQDGYARACTEFNADPDRRRCPHCGSEHPPADLTGVRWPEVAAAIRGAE